MLIVFILVIQTFKKYSLNLVLVEFDEIYEEI